MQVLISAYSTDNANAVLRHFDLKAGQFRVVVPSELVLEGERNHYDVTVQTVELDHHGRIAFQIAGIDKLGRVILAIIDKGELRDVLEVRSRKERTSGHLSGMRTIELCSRAADRQADGMASWVGRSPEAKSVREWLPRIATSDSSVLLTGETGAGKELAAELIHGLSPRSNGPFVCVNCAAIPDTLLESELFGYERGAFTGAAVVHGGKLEAADGGTLFLDEIGDMALSAQAKILRALETHEVQRLGSRRNRRVNFRVIAGTNQDLSSMMREGRFRCDLYYRLAVAKLELAPLRDRTEDVPLLLEHFLRHFNRKLERNINGFSPEAVERLKRYDWPGNVRELRNVVESLYISVGDDVVQTRNLSAVFGTRYESDYVRLLHVLQETKGNKSEAAKRMKWSRMTVYRKLAQIKERPTEGVATQSYVKRRAV